MATKDFWLHIYFGAQNVRHSIKYIQWVCTLINREKDLLLVVVTTVSCNKLLVDVIKCFFTSTELDKSVFQSTAQKFTSRLSTAVSPIMLCV